MFLKRAQANYAKTVFNNFKWKYEKLSTFLRVPHTTQNVVILRCCSAEEGEKCTEIFDVLGPLLFCSGEQVKGPFRYGSRRGLLKVDGTSFSDAGSLVTTAHLTREICPRDLKYRKSKTNMGAQKLLLTRYFFPVCPRLDQNKSCPLGVSC